MAWPVIVLAVYGVMNIALGLIAFVDKHSLMSLLGGGLAGILAIVAALLAKTNPDYGYGLGALVCVLLLGRFIPAQMKTGGWAPPVVIASSAIVLVALIAAHFTPAKEGP